MIVRRAPLLLAAIGAALLCAVGAAAAADPVNCPDYGTPTDSFCQGTVGPDTITGLGGGDSTAPDVI